jgi:nicotinamidase-related amidase
MPKLALEDLIAKDHTAVVFVEMQNGVVGPGSALPELAAAGAEIGLMENCGRLAAGTRSAGVRLIHATAENLPSGFGLNKNARLFMGARKNGAANLPGTEEVQPVAAVGVGPDDVILPRQHGLGPMTGSSLDTLLRNDGITTLVVAGVSLNVALQNLTMDAVNRSYQVVIPTDSVVGMPVSYGKLVLEHTLALLATLVTTDDILNAWGVA